MWQQSPPEDVARGLAEALSGFSGGPFESFRRVGEDGLAALRQTGLEPHHRLLDFGCGALRLGYWLVPFLDAGRYFGIEPQPERVEAGLRYALTPDLIAAKRPRFSHNSDCDMTVFGERFDFVVARSIFTHMAPGLLRKALRSFREASDGVMLASYWRSSDAPRAGRGRGKVGDELDADDESFMWTVRYSADYLSDLARSLGLAAEELDRPAVNDQHWLRFSPA